MEKYYIRAYKHKIQEDLFSVQINSSRLESLAKRKSFSDSTTPQSTPPKENTSTVIMSCEACKTIPPVVASGYVEKGTWVTLNDTKYYAVGPSTSTSGILSIYDIFGLAPQTLQGADLLSAALNTLVLVPDFFHGKAALGEWFGETTPEQDAAKGAFMQWAMDFDRVTKEFEGVLKDVKAEYKSVEKWGAYGLCWGGKVCFSIGLY